ncbi:putative amidoligase domain-containing protein [Paenibacillus lignilyticus]|uniref:Phage phiEco32-like COOH-NH2 ligase-type 2 n=1 Tax=Paenibacillus lignilyticus TaxID=1172615 RepID=A0ABS5CBU3_9BACL|nr:hypothetical protein [Paenibacillus lignilyticus]MBP3963419.1 hypothetical protein [Paenibacillus lignilyticus]
MAGRVWLSSGAEFVPFGGNAERAGWEGGPDAEDAVLMGRSGMGLAAGWRELSKQPLVINAGAAAFSLWDEEEVRRRLVRSGTAAWREEQGVNRVASYEVSLFQLLPIAVERKRKRISSHSELLLGEVSKEVLAEDARYKPFVRLAARALYACGLDNGIVELAEGEQGRCFVARITLPSLADYRQGYWKEAVLRLEDELGAGCREGRRERERERGQEQEQEQEQGQERERERVFTTSSSILIGADPEFLLLDGEGRVVSAARYLEGGHGAGCDAVVVRGQIRYPIAELRPAPAATPDELARNIRKLLQQAAQRIPSEPPLRWAAGGMPAAGFALGGHIHLSGVSLTGRLLRLLDSYIAFPLAMIESSAEQSRRPKYGFLGDFRLQPHGGFEYRTLPSWLVSPLAAKAAFALALLCARETNTFSYCPAEEERYVAAYYAGDSEVLRGCMDLLVSSMASTSSYRELAQWIEPLFIAIREGKKWDTEADLRTKWRIPAGSGEGRAPANHANRSVRALE